MFSIQLNDSQLIEVRDILTKYFADKATKEMDKLWQNNNWNNKTESEQKIIIKTANEYINKLLK